MSGPSKCLTSGSRKGTWKGPEMLVKTVTDSKILFIQPGNELRLEAGADTTNKVLGLERGGPEAYAASRSGLFNQQRLVS
jgi:hypothetical protein